MLVINGGVFVTLTILFESTSISKSTQLFKFVLLCFAISLDCLLPVDAQSLLELEAAGSSDEDESLFSTFALELAVNFEDDLFDWLLIVLRFKLFVEVEGLVADC